MSWEHAQKRAGGLIPKIGLKRDKDHIHVESTKDFYLVAWYIDAAFLLLFTPNSLSNPNHSSLPFVEVSTSVPRLPALCSQIYIFIRSIFPFLPPKSENSCLSQGFKVYREIWRSQHQQSLCEAAHTSTQHRACRTWRMFRESMMGCLWMRAEMMARRRMCMKTTIEITASRIGPL